VRNRRTCRTNFDANENRQHAAFLDFVLCQYVKEGVGELDQAKLPHLLELKYRAVSDAAAQLGGVAQIRDAFVGFQRHLYDG
jgi:type I restriction enzyme R subunit